jgi:hypothetical protein
MNLSKERVRIKSMGFQDADGSGRNGTWQVLIQHPTLDVNISYPSSLTRLYWAEAMCSDVSLSCRHCSYSYWPKMAVAGSNV